jgi:hypothetical protein
MADQIEAAIRQLIPTPSSTRSSTTSACRTSSINLSYSNAGTLGTLDGEILMSLKPATARPTS